MDQNIIKRMFTDKFLPPFFKNKNKKKLFVCVYHIFIGDCRGQKRMLGALELES